MAGVLIVKKIEMRRAATRMMYFVDGKRASIKTATQAVEENHREIVNSLLDTYEKTNGIESVAVKNDDFNPRANAGVFVLTVFAKFAWQFVPAPRGRKSDDDDLKIKRGYKNLADAFNAVQFVKKHLGRDYFNTGRSFTGAIIIKDYECYWQVMYRRGKEITHINAKFYEEVPNVFPF